MTLQNIPGGKMFWPFPTEHTYYVPSYVDVDAEGEYIGGVFGIPATGSLTDVAFTTGSFTGSDSALSVRVEGVDADTGFPDGTLIDSNAYGTINVGTDDDGKILVCALTGGVSVTAGTIVALKVAASANITGTLRLYHSFSGSTRFPYAVSSTGTPTKLGGGPLFALKIGGTWYAAYHVFGLINSVTAFATPKERGILINIPFKARLIGATAQLATGGGENYKYVLYSDPTGTPDAELTSDDFDADVTYGASYGTHIRLFNSSFVIQPNTNYVLAVQPTTAGAIEMYRFGYGGVTTYSSLYPGGSGNVLYSRDTQGTTSFTETNTEVPIISAIFDQLDDGAGTGGGGVPICANPQEFSWR